MRSHPKSVVLAPAVAATLTAVVATACSSADKATDRTAEPSGSAISTSASEPIPAGVASISPGGTTTRVDVPAAATESEYGQACLAAKKWMDEDGGEPMMLVEPYLKILQAPDLRDPGNFNTPWARLTPGQQAGVIMAVNAAANDECG